MSDSNTTSDTSSDAISDTASHLSSIAAQDIEPVVYTVDDSTRFPREVSFAVPQDSAQLHQIGTNDRSGIEQFTEEPMTSSNGHMELYSHLVYTEGAVHTIPLVLGIHLIPGEIIPLMAPPSFDSTLLILGLASTKLPFGVSRKIDKDYRSFGTIATLTLATENRQISLIGHQRFEILEMAGQGYRRTALARIKIIKDTTLYNPFNKMCLLPKKHNLGYGKMCSNRRRDIQEMFQTQWPYWVYNQFDLCGLVSQISNKVKMIKICKDIEISENPIFLSFQLTKLSIFSEGQISELLGIESTNLRLQRELQYLNNLIRNNGIIEYICDGPHCGARVCSMKDIFPMSTTILHGSNCILFPKNYKIITVLNLGDNLDLIPLQESNECNCFPGYRSTSFYCRTCHNHLGRKYVVNNDMQLTPMLFYALHITALKTMLVKTDH